MSAIDELYGEVIKDHEKKPRNYGPLAEANRMAEGHNPLCGDRLTVFLQLEDDVVRDIKFVGDGCAISRASASMMTRSVKGKARAEVEQLFAEFHGMVTGEFDIEASPNHLGHLKVFAGVRNFPVRVKCASLSWHTMRAALEGSDAVTTENLGPDLSASQISG